MNTIIGNATRSPQVSRSSVPPCRPPHHVLERAPQVFPSPSRCGLGSARSWPTGSPGFRLRLRPGVSTQALRIPSRNGHPALPASRDARPPGSARPLVYASPLRGCGGTFTPKRNALLGAQLRTAMMIPAIVIATPTRSSARRCQRGSARAPRAVCGSAST